MNLTDLLLLQDHLDKRGSGWFVLVALLETEWFRFRLLVVQLQLKLPAKVRHRSGNDDLAFLLLLYMLRHCMYMYSFSQFFHYTNRFFFCVWVKASSFQGKRRGLGTRYRWFMFLWQTLLRI